MTLAGESLLKTSGLFIVKRDLLQCQKRPTRESLLKTSGLYSRPSQLFIIKGKKGYISYGYISGLLSLYLSGSGSPIRVIYEHMPGYPTHSC